MFVSKHSLDEVVIQAFVHRKEDNPDTCIVEHSSIYGNSVIFVA